MRQILRAVLFLLALATTVALPAAASADVNSYRDLVMADDPAGYWPLDETSGPLGRNEISSGSRVRYVNHPLLDEDGAFEGSRGVTAGFRSLVDAGPPMRSDTDATYEVWFKMQPGFDRDHYEHIMDVPFDWGVWVYDGHLSGFCNGDPGISGPHVADGKWHHVAARLTHERFEIFVDGVRQGEAYCEYRQEWDRLTLGWGGGRLPFIQAMARSFDELAMYDRALPAERIAAHAAARTPADDVPGKVRAPVTGGAYTSAVLADQPFSFYRLEDRPWNPDGTASRVVRDSSPNGRHAQMQLGGADRAPGPIASEARNLSLRPRIHGFTVPAPSTADVSVEAWVKFTTDHFNTNLMQFAAGGRLRMYFRGEELAVDPYGPVTLGDGYWNDRAWHHVVATKNTATDEIRVYRDGVLLRDDSFETNDAPWFGTDNPQIEIGGGDALNPGYCLDEVAVYEGALSPARVAAHYDAADAELAKGGCGGTSDVRADLRPAKPANVSPPRARGVAQPGNVVWCDPGEWTGDPTTFRQQWRRDGVPVLFDNHEPSYLVTAADDGRALTCHVVAIGPGGESVEVASLPVTAFGRPAAPGVPRLNDPDGDVRNGFGLVWDATPAEPVPADGYVLQRRGADGVWHVISRPEPPQANVGLEPEGTHTFRVMAQSNGAESDPSPVSQPIVIDRTAPNPARMTVTGTAFGDWYRDSASVTWAHDGDPDLRDGTPGSGVDPSFEPQDVTLTTTGAHTVTANLRDRAGNGAVTERVVRVDAGAPTVTLSCPSVAHVAAIAHADVGASDGNGSGLDASVPTQITIDTSTPGVRTLSVTARDNVGHESTDSCDVPVVHRRPNAPQRVAGASPGDGAVTLAWTRHPSSPAPAAYVLEGRDANDAGWTEIARGAAESWTAPAGSPLAQGTWTFRVRIDDSAFDPEPSDASDPVVVDRTAPSAPSITPNRPPDASPDWWFDTVTLGFAGTGDPDLPDGSAGSGVDPASVPASVTYTTTGSHAATGTVRDRAGNTSPSASRTVRVDASAPTAAITCPATDVVQDSATTASWTASDTGSGLAGAASGTVALNTAAIGTHTVSTPQIRDRVGHVAVAATCTYRVIYDWTGFLDPVTNGPRYNRVDAGEIVPIMFSLNGNRGLGVLAGTPASVTSGGCNGQREDVSWTLPASWTAGLEYYAQYDLYLWPFRTQASWRNTCRQLTVALNDGTTHSTIFRFR
ncbi:MAG TPA: LamG-like jellyroll fold domain-containing protein [Solirubrobacteraceae bacterium]|nr:LamG-like jellyroll fold domain-containing protein [Solirubrobacteraceae bacterium]